MFSFTREGILFVAAGAAGLVAAPLLHTVGPAGGFVGGLTIVLPVMALYALGISAAVRMPARTVQPLGAGFGAAGIVALFLAAKGPIGWAGGALALLIALLALRDGAEAFWRGLIGLGFASLALTLVLMPIIPLGGPFIYAVSVAYLLLRHLWGVLAHDVPRALAHNAAAAAEDSAE